MLRWPEYWVSLRKTRIAIGIDELEMVDSCTDSHEAEELSILVDSEEGRNYNMSMFEVISVMLP